MSEFVLVANNPAPELAETFYFADSEGRKCRGLYAPALSQFGAARGTVLICPGRTEFVEKYFEVARNLQARGFAIVSFDWPGQGKSFRFLKDKKAGYVDDFDTYVSALRRGLNTIESKLNGPLVMLAHSMGGAIGLEALRQRVVEVDAAAFSSPMWGLKLTPIAYPIVHLMCALGQSKSLVHKHEVNDEYQNNAVTHDKQRWSIQPEYFELDPQMAVSAVTWGWVQAALRVTKRLQAPHALDHLNFPIFIASAEEEKLVSNFSHLDVASQLKAAEHIVVKGALHEILMETNDKRAVFWKWFDRLLDRANI